MTDAFAPYETGLTQLVEELGSDHPRYADALVYQQRLLESIGQSRGMVTPTRRSTHGRRLWMA